MGYIYKITSPTGKIYVGKTYNVRMRKNGHKCFAYKADHFKRNKTILSNSICKYGWDAHIFEIIEEVEDSLMNEREMHWIKELGSYHYENENGMNMTKGGEGQRSTWMHKTELRKWFSERFKGKNGPFYGRHHTEEAKRMLSQSSREYNLKNGIKVPEWGVEKGRKKVMKPILCYNSNGEFLKEYESATAAALDCGISKASEVCGVCSGKRTNALGFVFRYKIGDEIPMKIEIDKIFQANIKRPVIWIKKNGKRVEFPSSAEASVATGIPKTTINRASCYNNMRPIRTGHVFIYRDLLIENPTEVGVI